MNQTNLTSAVIATTLFGCAAVFYVIRVGQTQACRRKIPAVGKKVIFLDIDGVLNKTKKAKQIIFDPVLIDKLRNIIDRVEGVQIVLSTFWRPFDAYIAYVLSRHGIDGGLLVGATPGVSKSTTVVESSVRHLLPVEAFDDAVVYPNRAAEIRTFLTRNPQISQFAIIDDRNDAADAELLASFVRTDPAVGLTDEDVERAVGLLTGNWR